jgi:acetylglutamate synthase
MGVPSASCASDTPRETIAAAAQSGEIPLLTLREHDEEARELELARVLAGLATHKLIFLRNEAGLTLGGRPVSAVNLSDEFGDLMARPDLDAEHKRLLSCSRRLVFELLPHELLVTVTSPLSLLHELFTVKGAGTMLRRGARILRCEGLEGVDVPALRALLEDSFGKPLLPDALSRPVAHTYLEERYRGAALVAHTQLGSYLSKFAVTRQAQGEGIGRDLWQAMLGDQRVLFWRARPENPIRSWYEKQCDARVRVGEWIVYSIGLAPEHIPAAIAHALSQPLDL